MNATWQFVATPVTNEQKGHSLTLFDAILSQLVLFEILEKNED